MIIRLVGHTKNPVMRVGQAGPWYQFQKTLTSLQNKIVGENFGVKVEALIANSHSSQAIKECKENGIPVNRRILVLWEPKTVVPKTYSKKILKKYGKIYAPSVDWAEAIQGEAFNWPQLNLGASVPDYENWDLRKNKAVMVLANKFSACKGEKYSLRRKINYLCRKNSLLDLYGSRWNLGKLYNGSHYIWCLLRTPVKNIDLNSIRLVLKKFDNFKGLSEDKFVTASKYTISVVIENSSDYISEKLFDSISSGAITIYVGADLNKFGIDANSAYQVPASANEILDAIIYMQAKSADEQKKIARLQYQSLLKNSDAWECNLVLKKLAENINSYLTSTKAK